ncbi:ETC complex I subunit conserved region-domain-containing protein [Xylariaceae sp. FL0804]|nr:ETC complex I subunit conserved region-domain-containing protein [Xylariaceae sp. FL0804]
MRATLRLLASVKPARYLEAGNPTGLTGLYTHSSPRSTLLYLYSQTLDKLQGIPESSLYRQSVEALTRHRMAIVEAAEPPGHGEWAERAAQAVREARKAAAEWEERAQRLVAENPTYAAQFERAREVMRQRAGHFRFASEHAKVGGRAVTVPLGDRTFIHATDPQPKDMRYQEWDGEFEGHRALEGLRGPEDHEYEAENVVRQTLDPPGAIKWEPEPQMTAEQVYEVENKIGAGLIEEVVQVAEGELKLVDHMAEAKVWESLEEQPPAGQWEYFERTKP